MIKIQSSCSVSKTARTSESFDGSLDGFLTASFAEGDPKISKAFPQFDALEGLEDPLAELQQVEDGLRPGSVQSENS